MKYYAGTRSVDGTCSVWIVHAGLSEQPLPLRLDLENHSPTGFEWGYEGSGPAQLALALLADALLDDKAALTLHQVFKRLVVSKLRREAWELSLHDVLAKAVDAAVINAAEHLS